jgi:uncharacterized protein DUF732
MRKVIAILVTLAALSLSGCGNGHRDDSTARTNTGDQTFLTVVHRHNVRLYAVSDAKLLTEAHKVCTYFDQTGANVSSVYAGALREHNVNPLLFPTVPQAAYFMGAAAQTFCPEHAQALTGSTL